MPHKDVIYAAASRRSSKSGRSMDIGLKFPKGTSKKKKRKSHPPSILGGQKGWCYLCGRCTHTEVHHIFGGPNRTLSEEYGLKVDLCVECHKFGPNAVHRDPDVMEDLHRQGQEAFEAQIGSREEFMRIFGRNWL